MTEQRDYRDTVFLPKTDFPMKAGLPQKEPGILAKWLGDGLYAQLRAARAGREKFILHDGPPYANGDMHIGHALNHILKDMVVRTQTLLGKDAPYVPGWDCHGLPIEWKVEEEYRKKKKNKDEVPPREFRAECRAYAQHWVDTQREQLKRLGIGGDWDKPYLTMAPEAEGTIVAELMKFAESGQLYRGAKPVMWSPVEKTALAEAEVEYEDITSTQIDVAFEIVSSPIPELVGAHAVIWTTTPWTIPVNQAIAYGPELSYELVEWNGRRFLLAYGCQAASMTRWGYDPTSREARTLGTYTGSNLAGTIARHPMAKLFEKPLPFRGGVGVGSSRATDDENQGRQAEVVCANDERSRAAPPHPNPSPKGEGLDRTSPLAEFFLRPRPFLPGDFVTTDQGTGLVHMAPDHGEDDFELCKAHGIEPVFAVEGDGKYRADWAWLGGQGSVINPKFNAPDGPICSDLREAGALLAASADYRHSYPHSWRSKAKVIFRATPQWFIGVDKPLPFRGGVGVGSRSVWDADGQKPQAEPASANDSNIHAGPPHPNPSPEGEGLSLRQTALSEIDRVRFVPEKGRNRLRSMIETRPDWVISRQRAWGVPITLFVDRRTGQYLVDPEVNARIVAAVRTGGVDAWDAARAQEFLGSQYRADDFEMVTDILDVWFDSGCTHVFTLESDIWPEQRWPADLYLEGSDQHRGWFQSSLLESCGTRGRAPYDAVLTHGFTMDAKGMKMSKSLGNTINPIDLMRDYGADILRLWALSVDFTEDHRIGKEILQGVADQYRKLRNTFRYLLGALDGFDREREGVYLGTVPNYDAMPELERYILHLLADMDGKLRQAVHDYDFNSYTRLLSDFCNNDLSAFFFDIRKDSLYCDAPGSAKRRAYRTVLDILFHALVRYAAPVLVFTSEEVWGTRFPEAGSVHLLDWPEVLKPEVGDGFDKPGLVEWANKAGWQALRRSREAILKEIEPMRREKVLGSSLEAKVTFPFGSLGISAADFAELCIVSEVIDGEPAVVVTTHNKCGRCWRHLPEVTEDGALCERCTKVVS